MNRTLQIAWACVLVLVLATGCRPYRTQEFVAVQHPVKFENWRIYVNAFVDAANPSPTNHFYIVSAVAWTAPGDSIGSDVRQFRSTAYDASLDSVRLFRIAGTNAVEFPLPPLFHGSTDHSNRLVQLNLANGAGIEIPASVSELRADIVMTFRHRDTGRTETRVFTTTMLKEKGPNMDRLSKISPDYRLEVRESLCKPLRVRPDDVLATLCVRHFWLALHELAQSQY